MEVIDEFISDDLEDLTNYSDNAARSLKRNRSYSSWNILENIEQTDIDTFLKSVDLDSIATSDDLLAAFNNSELRSILNVTEFQFKEIKGLTKEHNKQVLNFLVLSTFYGQMDSLYLENKYSRTMPYLMKYDEELDSMIVGVSFGYQGPINNGIIELDGTQFELDSLPYYIGDVKGEVKFSFIGLKNKRIWYRNNL